MTKGVTTSIDNECEESLTLRDICSSILRAHQVVINSEPFTSESYEQNFERNFCGTYEETFEHPYQQNY